MSEVTPPVDGYLNFSFIVLTLNSILSLYTQLEIELNSDHLFLVKIL